MSNREQGVIRWFNLNVGYGFADLPDGRSVFIHHSFIARGDICTLTVGSTVSFEIVENHKGLTAKEIWIL